MFPRRLTASLSRRRAYSTPAPAAPPPPPPPPKPVSPHVNVYKEFGRPFAKVFLMGIFTYQVLYWTWMKMEKDEEKREKNAVIETLQKEVERLKPTAGK